MTDPAKDLLPLGTALARYFEENGFGADGGYGAAFVDFKIGPVPFPFPNTKARKRAVPFHDLHHLVTGYATDTRGEFEISAWEIGSGCRGFVAAWQLNLGGMGGGLVACPVRSFRAFARGRRSDNFYGREYDAKLLATTVGDAKAALHVDAHEPRRGLAQSAIADVLLFALASAAGVLVGTATLVLCLPLAIVALPVLHVLARRARAKAAPGYETSRTHSAAT